MSVLNKGLIVPFALAAFVSGAALSGSVPPPLILHYSFNEVMGQAIDTGAAPAANGVLLGQAGRTGNTPGGFSRSALDLSGISTDYVSAGDTDKLDNLLSYTISFWLNLRDTNLGTGRILGKHDLAASGFDLVAAPSNSSGFSSMSASEFSLQLAHEAGIARSTADLDARNRWVFVGVSYDGSRVTNNLHFYVGGDSSTVSLLGTPVDHQGGAATDNTVDFTLGGAGPVFADLTLPALLDDVRIYQGILPPSSLELIRLSNVSYEPDGDFNDDLAFDCLDADLLTMQIASGGGDFQHLFDMNGDGQLDSQDLDTWLATAGTANLGAGFAYARGDANLDGTVDGNDFLVWNAHKFSSNARWCSGDFDANGVVDGADFLLWNANKFPHAVPEAHRFLTAWIVWCSIVAYCRKRSLNREL